MTDYEIKLEAKARMLDESTDYSWLWAGFFGIFYYIFFGFWKEAFGVLFSAIVVVGIVGVYQIDTYGDIPAQAVGSDYVSMGIMILIAALMAKPAWKRRATAKAKDQIIYEAMTNAKDT